MVSGTMRIRKPEEKFQTTCCRRDRWRNVQNC